MTYTSFLDDLRVFAISRIVVVLVTNQTLQEDLGNAVMTTCHSSLIRHLGRSPARVVSPIASALVTLCALCVLGTAQAAVNDHDGDGNSDILWQSSATGQVVLWPMDGATRLDNLNVTTVSNPAWTIAGDGDYDGDGIADLLWRNADTGQIIFWKMNGALIDENLSVSFVADSAWQIVASADLNGDGRSDLVWRHGLSGQVVYWQMNGAMIDLNANISATNLAWQIVATGRFDNDSNEDILWRNRLSGQMAMWTMNGQQILGNSNVTTVADENWQIVGVGKYDLDNKADILWRNFSTGQNALWLMDGPGIAANLGVPSVTNLDWEVVGDGDYDGDLKADVLWRHAVNGQNALWTLDGAFQVQNLGITAVGEPWQINDVQIPAPYSGLGSRPSNLTCVAPDQPTTNASIATEDAFPNLPGLPKAVALLQAPGDTTQWFIVEQDGRVLRFEDSPTVSTFSTFIDIRGPGGPVDVDSSAGEAGLLGIAFHPNYAVNRQVFLSYTVDDTSGTFEFFSRVSRFTSNDNGLTLDPNSEDVLLSLPQPYRNHNGGNILFGPDGFLYVGFGDGGSSGDPGDRAQNTSNLFGTILRIDVDGGTPYGIPATNPNSENLVLCDAGSGASPCPEIYAWGLRNPWRWSFDSLTGDLWLGDVGQNNYEEVDIVELGGNYGWRCREGAHDFDTTGVCPPGLIDPIIEYDHNEGNSVTGGYVYRGSDIPELIGRYVFADFVQRKIFASTTDTQGNFGYEVLLDVSDAISSFAQDENGEILYIKWSGSTNSRVRRIIQSGGSSVNTIPDQLSATGCVDGVDPTEPAAGLIPYEINVPFWSDGAAKERFYAIPDGTTIDVDTDGDWLFPIGTVLLKNFRLNDVLFETRLFMRHTNGEWAGYTYEWNQAGTDATRVVGGKTTTVQGQTWAYPSESQCMNCHTEVANSSLGVEHAHLNRDLQYPSTGLITNQLETAERIGMLTAPLADDVENLPQFYDLTDTGTLPPLEDSVDAARSYLHSNCAGCHRPSGPTPSNMDLQYGTDFVDTDTCDVAPTSGDLGVPNALLISPGIAAESIIPNRMNRRDVHGMPPLASAIPDAYGFDLINQWINDLTVCPP